MRKVSMQNSWSLVKKLVWELGFCLFCFAGFVPECFLKASQNGESWMPLSENVSHSMALQISLGSL